MIPGFKVGIHKLNYCKMMKITDNRLMKTIGLITLSGLMMYPLAFADRDQNAREKGNDKEHSEQKKEKKEKSKNKNTDRPDRAKIRHLRRAAKQLEAAGNKELAGKVLEQIKGMRSKATKPEARKKRDKDKKQGASGKQGAKTKQNEAKEKKKRRAKRSE